MNLDREISACVARLQAGEDPHRVLGEFARVARGQDSVTVERLVPQCASCGSKDAVCFHCKAVQLVGEQGLTAAPLLAARIVPMIKQWASERKARKAAQEAHARAQAAAQARSHAQQARRAPPPPEGPQSF